MIDLKVDTRGLDGFITKEKLKSFTRVNPSSGQLLNKTGKGNDFLVG
jgi:hypothetical protein